MKYKGGDYPDNPFGEAVYLFIFYLRYFCNFVYKLLVSNPVSLIPDFSFYDLLGESENIKIITLHFSGIIYVSLCGHATQCKGPC